jgi:hypothetical protein
MPGYRDRTNDFQALAQSFGKTNGKLASATSTATALLANEEKARRPKSAFATQAQQISTQIQQTSAKLQQLAKRM